MLSLRERAALATLVRKRAAERRAELLRRFLEDGECLKRAAFNAGVSYRTARRYRAERIGR